MKEKMRAALLGLTLQDKYFTRAELPAGTISYNLRWGNYVAVSVSKAKGRWGRYYITPKGYRLIRGEI